jgi:3-deoxy-D-manno-octulosonic-acid transferase
MRSVLWGLYQIATGAALLTAGPFLLARRGGHYLPTLAARLGRAAGAARVTGGVWLHAVSVGEVGVAATLARALPPQAPLLVTTVTPTGQARARSLFLLGSRPAEIAYLPFDLGFAVRRFYDRFTPRALVLVEGDYWPLVLREARRRGLPVAVVNGRVGDRSFARMRRLRPFLGPLFAGIDRFGVQTEDDRTRLVTLGIPPEKITVTGNLKYESPEPPRKPELEEALGALAVGRPILLAGSTMAGEEEQVLAAQETAGGGARALLVLAPRHPERWNEVDALLRARGIAFVRRSTLPATGSPGVVLLDSLGELAGLYRLAAAAFIGGTLVPSGGHNPLEAARFGVPVAVGPSMHNFREMAGHFDRAGSWHRAADARALGEIWKKWLDDPAAAREQGARGLRLVEENRGALAKTIDMLAPLLALTPGPSPASGRGENSP